MIHFYVQEDLALKLKQRGTLGFDPEWIIALSTLKPARTGRNLCKHLSWLKQPHEPHRVLLDLGNNKDEQMAIGTGAEIIS